jgi:ABC-2 type transport system permease protein
MKLPTAAFAALMRKDLVLYFSNRRALVTSILAPILIAAFFGSLFGGKTDKPARIPVVITDLDHSPLSARVLASLQGDASFELSELDEPTATARVTQGQARAAIVLPAGFGAAAPGALFGARAKPVITVRYDPSQAMVLAVVRGLLTQHLMQAVSQTVFSGQVSGPGGTTPVQDWRRSVQTDSQLPADQRHDLLGLFDSIERLQRHAEPASAPISAPAAASATAPATAASAGAQPGINLPFETQEIEASSQPEQAYNSYAHSFAGMSVQFILFMGVELGISVLLARRLGLWKRLRAAPVSRGVLLGSRILSGAVTALVLMAAIYAAAMALFGVRVQGSWLGFIGVCIAFSLLTASFGMLIAALGKTPEATRGLTIFVTLILVMLGGAWVPSFIFPEWLQTVSLFVPTRWAIDGLDAMTWRGLGLQAALAPIGVTLAFAAAFAAVAVWRFDWEE